MGSTDSNMKKISAFVLGGAFLMVACNGDDTTEIRKGQVDEDMLSAGVQVTIAGDVGTVDVPMALPVPNVTNSQLEGELQAACAFTLSSDQSGATVDILAGNLVDGDPASPGDYSYSINDARDTITVSFYNQSPGGLTVKTDRTYTAAMAIEFNDYIEVVENMTFTVTPTGG